MKEGEEEEEEEEEEVVEEKEEKEEEEEEVEEEEEEEDWLCTCKSRHLSHMCMYLQGWSRLHVHSNCPSQL